MRLRRLVVSGVALVAFGAGSAGCTGVLGDFTVSTTDDAGAVDGGPLPDAGDSGGPKPDGSAQVSAERGLGLTAGGAAMKSQNYHLFAGVGESPGGNTTSNSAKYRFQGGVVGVTSK